MSQLPLHTRDDQDRELRELFIALGAPAARHASAFASTEEITLTWEVIELFAKAGGQPVRREELRQALAERHPGPAVDARLRVLEELRVLVPEVDRPFERRLRLSASTYVFYRVLLRLRERGGFGELMQLLGSTRLELEEGLLDPDSFRARLGEIRTAFHILAGGLERAVRHDDFDELLAQVNAPSAEPLAAALRELVADAAGRFAAFQPTDRAAEQATLAVAHYAEAVDAYATRLLREGSAGGDYRVLSPERARRLAIHGTVEQLGSIVGHLPFDPPRPLLTPTSLLHVKAPGPRRAARRPNAPEIRSADSDPLADARQRRQQRLQRREYELERLLAGAQTRDITGALQFMGWRRAATLLGIALAAGSDPRLSTEAVTTDELLIRPGEEVTYLSRLALTIAAPRPAEQEEVA